MRIDLHTHTTYSDGTFTPAESVALAVERGLAAVSISDHDSTEGLDEAFRAAEGTGLEVVPGVELSTVYQGGPCTSCATGPTSTTRSSRPS